MVSKENPIALLEDLKERAMGFFLKQTQPSTSSQIVGVDISQSHLLVLGVEKNQGSIELVNFRLEPRPSSPEAVSEKLKSIFKEEGFSTRQIRTVLKSDGMVIRILNFPQMKKNELASMLQYEVEKYIPFKANEVFLDFQIINESVQQGDLKSVEILLAAVKQNEITQLIALFQNAGLALEVIDVCAFALANLIEFAYPESMTKPLAFLDMGMENSTFGIILHGQPIFIRDISFGGSDIKKLMKRKQALQQDSQSAVSQKGLGEQTIAGLVSEVKLSLGYYLDHVQSAEPIQGLFVSGEGFRSLENLSALEKGVGVPTSRLDFLSRVQVSPRLKSSILIENQDLIEPALGVCIR